MDEAVVRAHPEPWNKGKLVGQKPGNLKVPLNLAFLGITSPSQTETVSESI
jgi:hypothetical protein